MDFSQFDLTDPFVRRALAETLAEDNGLDYQDEYIRKALNDEIAAAAAPKPIDGERNFFGDTVSRLARGGVQLADTAIHAVDTAVGGSETLQGWSDSLDKAKQNVGLLRPDKSEHEEGWLKRSYGQALESAPMSAVPWAGAMAGAKAGAALGTTVFPGVGTAAGTVAGSLIGGAVSMAGLFFLGTYGQRKEEIERELTATRPDLTPDQISKMAHDNALHHGNAETWGETAGDLASWAILSKVPGGQAIFKGGKAVLAELVKPNAFKAIALGVGKAMPFEVGSEVGTAIWQNEADKAIGVEQGTSTDAALAAIGPALFLSAGMGVAVGGYSANQRRVQYNALNSEDQGTRAQAVDQVAGTLAEATDQQTAKKWRDMALGFVQNGQPIPLDMNLAELSANEPEVAAPEAQDQPAETILKAESVDEAIQEAEAEIAKPGWLAPTAPDLEESAWLQQGVAAKAYNQGRNELGATPVSRAGLLGQAMEPMQVAAPADPLAEVLTTISTADQPTLLQMADGLPGLVEGSPELAPYQRQLSEAITARQRILWEESNVGRGTVSGDSGTPQGQPEQPAGIRDIEPIRGDSGRQGDGESGEGGSGVPTVAGNGFDPKGLTPGSPEYEAAYEQHAEESREEEAARNKRARAARDQASFDDRNKVKAEVVAWFDAASDGDTITTDMEGEEYRVKEYEVVRKGKRVKFKTLVLVGGRGGGRDRALIADQDGKRVAGPIENRFDEDGIPVAEHDDSQSIATLGYMLRDGRAKSSRKAAPISPADDVKAPKPTRSADEPARAFLARKREWENSVSQTGGNETQAELPRTDETQAGAQGADIGPNTPDGYVTAKKQPGGKYKLFFTGTRNEVFSGELFDSAKQARDYFRVQREKLRQKQAHTTPKTTSTSDLPGVGTETAPSPGEASKPAAQPSASRPQRLEIDKVMNDSTFSEDGDESHRAKIARQSAAGKKWAKEMAAAGRVEEVEDIAEAHVFGFSEMQDKFVSGVEDGLSEHWQETKGKDFNPMALILSGPEKPTERDLERKKGVLARLQANPHAKEIREKITALEEQIKANEAKIEDWSSRSYKQTGARYENREGGLSSTTAANERRRSRVIEGARIAIADANALAAEYRQQLSGVDDKVARVSGEIKVIEKSLAAQPSASKATPEKPEAEQLVRWQNAVNAYVNGEDAANARTDTIDRALQNGLVKPGETVAFAEWLIGQGGRPGLVDHARKVQGGTESTEDSHSDKVKDIENVVAQKRARVERTLAAMKKGTKAQKEAAGREHLFAKKELQGWEQVLEDVRAEQQPPTTPAQDRTPEKPAGVATSGQRQEQAADAKPRKDADMADVAETDFGNMEQPAQPAPAEADTYSSIERELQRSAHKGRKDGDIEAPLNWPGPDGSMEYYVSMADAVAAARKFVAAGGRPVPFQMHNGIGVSLGDADTIIAALDSPAQAESASGERGGAFARENVRKNHYIKRKQPGLGDRKVPWELVSVVSAGGVMVDNKTFVVPFDQITDIRTGMPDLGRGEVIFKDGAPVVRKVSAQTTSEKDAETASSNAEKSDVSPKSPNAPIADFGEKIGGARKDVWSKSLDDMRQVDDADVAAQPLSKVWPAPDYQKMLEEEGADKSTVALVRALRDSIPTKPRAGWKLQKWAEAVTAARGVAVGLLDGSIDTARARHAIQVVNASKLGEGILDQAELYELVGHEKSLAGIRIASAQYSMLNGVEYNPSKELWSVEQPAKATAFSNWPRQLSIGETRQEAIEKFVAKYNEMEINKPASKQVDFSIYSYRSGKEGFYVGKKVGRNYIDLAGPFDTAKEARKYKSENQEALVDKLAKAKEIPSERRDTNNPRVGEDMRGGQDVTPEMFRDAFGFRGVEFGNWVEQKKRQSDLNDAYDALMDMAAILEITPKAISLNGELALAFGARGSGGRSAGGNTPAAHYEPGKVVINLTKKRGAGSLGHEWWHALDNYFAKMRKGDGYLTEALDVSLVERGSVYEHKGEVRKEMVDAFGGVMKAIRSTAMKARASKLDNRRSAAYWTTKPEMSARAFESYLISKLHDQGASNDYLANIVDDQTWKAAESLGFELDDSYPYPTAGEMPKIRGAFDHFFQTVEQKGTDKGVALFSTTALPPSARADIQGELAQAFGKLRARVLMRKITVLGSQEEAKALVRRLGGKLSESSSQKETPPSLSGVNRESDGSMTVFHGSLSPLTGGRFDLDAVGKNRATTEGWGAYFSTDKKNARKFGKNILIVNLSAADVETLLDEGAPLSKQTKYVRDAIGRFYPEITNPTLEDIKISAVGYFRREYNKPWLEPDPVRRSVLTDIEALKFKPKELVEYLDSPSNEKIKEYMRQRIIGSTDPSGIDIYTTISERHGSDKRASEMLLSMGIKGKVVSSNRDLHSVVFNSPNIIIFSQSVLDGVVDVAGPPAHSLRYSKDGAIQGIYANGKTYLVADGIAKNQAVPVLLHELGEHAAQLGFAGDREYQGILRSLEKRAEAQNATGKAIRAAMARAPEDTLPEHYWSEVAAYLVENKANSEIGIVKRVLNFFKKWLYKAGAINADRLTPEDLVLFARSATLAHTGATYGEGVRQSARDLFKPVDTESAAFRDWARGSVVQGKVYSGQPVGRDVFDGVERGELGGVGYFTKSKKVASLYAGTAASEKSGETKFSGGRNGEVGEYYLNIKNPYDPNDYDIPSKEWLKGVAEEFDDEFEELSEQKKIDSGWSILTEKFGYPSNGEQDVDEFLEYGGTLSQYIRENIRPETVGSGYDTEGISYSVFGPMMLKFPEVFEKLRTKNNFDAIVYEDGEHDGAETIIVFSPTQVKSAKKNTGAFSPTDPRIHYSKRFEADEAEAAVQVKPALHKNDLKWWERIFKTFDYLSRIDPAAKRIFQYGAEDRRENKVRLEDRILDDISVPDGAYTDPQYAEKKKAGFVSFLTSLQKKGKATYTAANDYLLTVDRTGKAFSVKRQEGYTVKSPDGEVLATGLRTKEDGYAVIRDHHAANYGKDSAVLKKDYSNDKQSTWAVADQKGAILSEHNTEAEAVAARREAEAGKMRADGKDEKTIAAVMKFREMTDRAFDLMAGDLRRVIDEAERLGLDEPTMEVVDERKRYVILDAHGNKVPESYYENRKDAELFAESISNKGRFQVKKQADNEILMPMTLSAAISQMGDLRGSYFPRQRQAGAVVLTATKDGSNIRKNFDLYMLGGERTDIETGEVLTESKIKTFLRDRANRVTPLGLEMARLKADGYTVKVAPADRMPETVFEATQLFASINALIEDAAKGVKKDADPNLQRAYNELAKTLTMNIADTFKQRGYLSSRMKRTQDYWEGFETDMLKAGVQYAKGMAGGLAKREAAQKMTLALTGRETTFAEYQNQNPGAKWEDYQQFVRDNAIDPKKQPRLLEETKSWMQEMLRNDEQADRILGTIKGLAVLKFLGFRVSSAAVNMTNMVQAVPATIAAQTGTSISRALGQVGSSARLYKQYRTGKAEQVDKEIFTEISERGWDNPQFNHEAAAVLRSKAGNWFAKFTDAAMWMFGQAEKVNRAVTIHAAYMQAKRMSPDLGHVGWMTSAKQISDDAHGVYGKETAPAWTRGAYNPLKLAYTFQRFMHNYFLNMGQMWERGKYKELTWMLISPALIAGPGATLLTPIAASMLGALGIGGDDPEEEFYTWAEQTFGEGSTGARVARHGFSGALGVNLKGSLEMGFAMPTTVAELFGAPGSLVTDAVDSARAFGKGEVSKGFEKALPTGIGTILKANREQREGVTTGGYSPVWYGEEPLKTTGGGSVARFFGFNPSVTSGVREKLWSEKRIEQKYAGERKRINDRIRRLVLQNNGRIPREDMDEIRGEVARYNERARGLAVPGVPLIKASTIRQAIRSAKRPPRKERLRTNPNI